MKYFIGTIIGIVTLTIAVGIFIVGSPQEARLRLFDEQRVQHLQMIQSEIVFYWQQKSFLPQQLTDLVDPLRGFTLPNDPERSTDYEYIIGSDLSFSLCGVFHLPSQDRVYMPSKPMAPYPMPMHNRPIPGDSWEHEAGRVCFQRSMDPGYYAR